MADLVAAGLLRESLMTEKLARRGLRVQAEYHVDVLQAVMVGEVMTSPGRTLPASATAGEVRRAFDAGGHGAYPLVDDEGHLAGIVSREDLLRIDVAAEEGSALDLGSTDVVTAAPEDPLFIALERMLVEGVEHLPVVSDGALVGMCTRTDVLRPRQRQLDLERPQSGWRPAAWRPPASMRRSRGAARPR